MNKLTKVALLAITAASFASLSASAANVSTGSTDLILGFQVTDASGTGGTSDLEIDLGAASNFTSSTNQLTLNQLATADLVATYGANWATRGDLTWGVAGITDASGNTHNFDATYSGSNPQNASSLATAFGNVGALVAAVGGSPQTANSSSSAVIGSSTAPAAGISNSWTAEENNGLGNSDFGYFNPSGVTEVNGGQASGNPIGSLALDTFTEVSGKQTNKPASQVGTFSLDAQGDLTYIGVNGTSGPPSTPEPSAYALGLCAVVLFFVLKRRHSVV